jgi:hypothetical protein
MLYEEDKKALFMLLNQKEDLIKKLSTAIDQYNESRPLSFSLISIFNRSLPSACQCLEKIQKIESPYDKLAVIRDFFNGNGGWGDISMKTLFLEQINGEAMKKICSGLPKEVFREKHCVSLLNYAEEQFIAQRVKKSLIVETATGTAETEIELKPLNN